MSDADEERVNEHPERQENDQTSWTGWLGSKPWWQEENEEYQEEEKLYNTREETHEKEEGASRLPRSISALRKSRGEITSRPDIASEPCELAPHSTMNLGAGRVDSPSPQDIRLLHDLVEDLAKEQDEKTTKPRDEQVRFNFKWKNNIYFSKNRKKNLDELDISTKFSSTRLSNLPKHTR